MKGISAAFIAGVALKICLVVAVAVDDHVAPEEVYKPPVPLQEARPVIPGPGGSECCAVTEEAAKTQGEAEKELARTLKSLVQSRSRADAARTKKSIAKLLTENLSEQAAARAVEAKAKKDAAVAEAEAEALERELAAVSGANRQAEDEAQALDEELLNREREDLRRHQQLRESVAKEIQLVENDVDKIKSGVPEALSLLAQTERRGDALQGHTEDGSVAMGIGQAGPQTLEETGDVEELLTKAAEGRGDLPNQKRKSGHVRHVGTLAP